jgi:hypothetical protein
MGQVHKMPSLSVGLWTQVGQGGRARLCIVLSSSWGGDGPQKA